MHSNLPRQDKDPPEKDVLETPVVNLARPPAAPHPTLFPQTYLEFMRRSERRCLEKMNANGAWEEEPEIVRPVFESFGRKNVPILLDFLDDPKPNWQRMWEARQGQEHRRWLHQQRLKAQDQEWDLDDFAQPPEKKEEVPSLDTVDLMDLLRSDKDRAQTPSSAGAPTPLGGAAAWGATTFPGAGAGAFRGTPSGSATGTLAPGTPSQGRKSSQLVKNSPGFVIGGGRGLSSGSGQRSSVRRSPATPGSAHAAKQRSSNAMTAPDGLLQRSSSAAATRSGSRGDSRTRSVGPFAEQARSRLSSPSAGRRSGLRPRRGEPLEPLGPGHRPVPGPGGRR